MTLLTAPHNYVASGTDEDEPLIENDFVFHKLTPWSLWVGGRMMADVNALTAAGRMVRW